ncbi:MAG: InlB B-repeat-containing protein, partial [Candidatus Methanomethylophilaceae archaeon]
SCSSLNNVSVPNGMSSIGNYAFYGCSSLKNITFGTGLRTISDYAFYGCAAKSIDLPQSLTSIGASSFRDCKQLKSVEIPSAVTSIGGYAFADCYGVKTLILEIPVTVSAGTFGTQCFGFGTSTNPVDVGVKWDGATTTIICLLKTTYATMDQYTNMVDTDFTVTVYYTFEKGALTDAGRSSIVSAGGTYYIPSVDDLDIDSDFKTGKYVESWYEVISGGQMEKITGTEFVVVNDTVICVNYEFNRYTVTFYNSGSISDGTFGSPLSVKEGDTVSEPLIDPVKEGNTFDKWYSNSACTVEYDFCTKIARNVNIYAGWIPDTYTINFQSGDFVDYTNVVIVWSEGHCSLTGSGVTRLITTTTANGQGYTMVLTYEDFVTYYNSRFPLTIGTVSNTNESVRFVSTSGTFFTDNVLTRSSFSNIGDGKYSVVVRTEFYSDYVMVYDMNSTDTLIAGISSFKVSGYSDDDVVVLPTVDEISDKGVGFKGYDFLGWSTTEEGTVLFAGNSNFEPTGGLGSVADANREVRLYAIWSPIEYTVVYTGYGIMTETVNVETGNVSTVIGKTLANEGYMDFKGWSLTNSASGNNIILTSSNVMKDLISSNNNTITLYSVWGDRAYLLKYELNKSGETADMSSYNKYCSVGDAMITPDLSDRYSGVTFLGWSSDSKATVATEYTEFTSQMADSTGTNLTYTLYGVWEYTEYSISFMVDKVGVEAPQVLTKYHLGDPITLPTVKDISGYSFAGWSLDDENANSLLNNVKTFTQEMATSGSTNGNVTLFYASWTENSYTVEYEDRTKVATFDQGFSLDTPVKTGYLFKGWKSDDIDGDTSKKSYDGKNWSPWDGSLVDTIYFKNLTTGTGTVNLVAEWEEITYTVVYNMNGVPLDAPEDETYVLNEDFTVATPGVTENGGQTFVGWATSPDATSRYSFPAKFSSTMVRMTDDEGVVTLYAVWKDTESVTTVSIDLNGGTPSKIPSGWHKADDGTYYTTVEKGVDTSDILNDWNDVSVSKSGYSSAGWDYSDTVVSDDGSTVIVLTYDEVSYSSMFIGFGLVAAIFIVGILFARRER